MISVYQNLFRAKGLLRETFYAGLKNKHIKSLPFPIHRFFFYHQTKIEKPLQPRTFRFDKSKSTLVPFLQTQKRLFEGTYTLLLFLGTSISLSVQQVIAKDLECDSSRAPSRTDPLTRGDILELRDELHLEYDKNKSDDELYQECFDKVANILRNPTQDKSIILENEKFSTLATKDGKTLFLLMVEEGQEEIVMKLLKSNIDYRVCDQNKNNGLHIAAKNGHINLIPLLTNYFDVDQKNEDGQLAIHIAIVHGHTDVVRALYENGSKINIPWVSSEKKHFPPIALAVKSGKIEIIDILAKTNPQRLRDVMGDQPSILHLAIMCEKHDSAVIIKFLFTEYPQEMKELLYRGDQEGRTPLHLAAFKGKHASLIYLVQSQNLDVNLEDTIGNGLAPIHWAAKGEHPETIQALYKEGANLACSDANGKTPLSYLEEMSSKKANECKILLKKLPRKNRLAKAKPQAMENFFTRFLQNANNSG